MCRVCSARNGVEPDPEPAMKIARSLGRTVSPIGDPAASLSELSPAHSEDTGACPFFSNGGPSITPSPLLSVPKFPPPSGIPSSFASSAHAPLSSATASLTTICAKEVLDLLMAHCEAINPWWETSLWASIGLLKQAGRLDDAVQAALLQYGNEVSRCSPPLGKLWFVCQCRQQGEHGVHRVVRALALFGWPQAFLEFGAGAVECLGFSCYLASIRLEAKTFRAICSIGACREKPVTHTCELCLRLACPRCVMRTTWGDLTCLECNRDSFKLSAATHAIRWRQTTTTDALCTIAACRAFPATFVCEMCQNLACWRCVAVSSDNRLICTGPADASVDVAPCIRKSGTVQSSRSTDATDHLVHFTQVFRQALSAVYAEHDKPNVRKRQRDSDRKRADDT